jgi:hypothetical protein
MVLHFREHTGVEGISMSSSEIALGEQTFRLSPSTQTGTGAHLEEGHRWQVILTPMSHKERPLAIELQGDVVIGWASPDDPNVPDINLAEVYGNINGVSARHIMLRPAPSKLFLLDLHSDTGTFINTIRLGTGWAYAVQDNDLIGLGSFWIKLKSSRPS